MSERFYRQRDNLTMNNQGIPPSQRRPKGTISTYYEQVARQKQAKVKTNEHRSS